MLLYISDFQILSLSQVTIGKLSIGHIVNLASNDVQRFELVTCCIQLTPYFLNIFVIIYYCVL